MDVLRAAVGPARPLGRLVRPDAVVRLARVPGALVDPRVAQLYHDHHQRPRPGDDLVPDAALGVGAVRHGDPGPAGAARALGRGHHAAVRPDDRDALLRPGGGRPG